MIETVTYKAVGVALPCVPTPAIKYTVMMVMMITVMMVVHGPPIIMSWWRYMVRTIRMVVRMMLSWWGIASTSC